MSLCCLRFCPPPSLPTLKTRLFLRVRPFHVLLFSHSWLMSGHWHQCVSSHIFHSALFRPAVNWGKITRQWIAIETNEIRMEKSYWEYLSTEMLGQWPWFVHGCSTHAHKLSLWKASAILFFPMLCSHCLPVQSNDCWLKGGCCNQWDESTLRFKRPISNR